MDPSMISVPASPRSRLAALWLPLVLAAAVAWLLVYRQLPMLASTTVMSILVTVPDSLLLLLPIEFMLLLPRPSI